MRIIALFILGFVVGFIIHARYYPNLLVNQNLSVAQVLGTVSKDQEPNKSLTIITFKNGMFYPERVAIKRGYYVAVRNGDENELMWLISNNPLFVTSRGFGLSEEIKVRLDKLENIIIKEKNHLNKQAVIIVE